MCGLSPTLVGLCLRALLSYMGFGPDTIHYIGGSGVTRHVDTALQSTVQN